MGGYSTTEGLHPMGNAYAHGSSYEVQSLGTDDSLGRVQGPHARALVAVPQPPIRVRLVTHTELIAAGVVAMIGEHPGWVVVVANSCPPDDVDVVLLDGANPATIVSDIGDLTASGHRLIVVFDWHLDPATMARARAAGAAGFVSKSLGAHDLLGALGSAFRKGPRPASSNTPHVCHPNGLSTREAHVVALIGHGLSNNEIAAELVLSINTIKTYIRAAYQKIGVASRSQAVAWAFGHGFVPKQRQVPAQGSPHIQSRQENPTAGAPHLVDTSA